MRKRRNGPAVDAGTECGRDERELASARGSPGSEKDGQVISRFGGWREKDKENEQKKSHVAGLVLYRDITHGLRRYYPLHVDR